MVPTGGGPGPTRELSDSWARNPGSPPVRWRQSVPKLPVIAARGPTVAPTGEAWAGVLCRTIRTAL